MSLVVNGALLTCSFGVAPCQLMVIPTSRVFISNQPVASIADCIPMVNIKSFGMCNTMTNHTVAAATAAKLGVFTPMPCIPVIATPWISTKPTLMSSSSGILLQSSDICMCAYGGIIKILFSGQCNVT